MLDVFEMLGLVFEFEKNVRKFDKKFTILALK